MELFGILAKSNLCWFTNIDYFFAFMLCLLEVERTVEGYFPCAVRMAVRMFSIEQEPVHSLVRELRFHKLHSVPHRKTLSVCRDPISHLHQDWATSTALPLGTHSYHSQGLK